MSNFTLIPIDLLDLQILCDNELHMQLTQFKIASFDHF